MYNGVLVILESRKNAFLQGRVKDAKISENLC